MYSRYLLKVVGSNIKAIACIQHSSIKELSSCRAPYYKENDQYQKRVLPENLLLVVSETAWKYLNNGFVMLPVALSEYTASLSRRNPFTNLYSVGFRCHLPAFNPAVAITGCPSLPHRRRDGFCGSC